MHGPVEMTYRSWIKGAFEKVKPYLEFGSSGYRETGFLSKA
jgi:hypothetical protein